MRKLLLNGIFASTALFLGLSTAQAQTAAVNIDSLAGACVVMDASGYFYTIVDPRIVQNKGKDGNVILHCSGQLPDTADYASQGAVILDYGTEMFSCGLGGGYYTDDWINIVTKRGRVNLICNNPPTPTS